MLLALPVFRSKFEIRVRDAPAYSLLESWLGSIERTVPAALETRDKGFARQILGRNLRCTLPSRRSIAPVLQA